MKPRILIEVKDGNIIFIGSNTEDIEVSIIDHDWDDPVVNTYEPDSIMTDEGIDDYIKLELKTEEE